MTTSRVRVAVVVVVVVLTAIGVVWIASGDDASVTSRPENTTVTTGAPSTTRTPTTTAAAADTTLVLDPAHDYGDRYADGILPVGDGKYVLDAPKAGYVFVCRAPQGGGGAFTRGPWFVHDDTEYDVNKKVAVTGNVAWDASFTMTLDETHRTIVTNDLPRDDTTGVFPVQPNDPAYQYDRNPNSIAAQSLTYALDVDPTVKASPSCVGGESGVMLTGVALFDAFDAGGRDAGAWEVQDGCDGHPQITHEYHYHTLSTCIAGTSVDTVLGFALDGFPITGPKLGPHNILATADLDECHGITSTIQLDGHAVTTYHYVMTQDFPYSVSCFRGTPIPAPH